MDDTDKQLLNILQSGFPIAPRPFRALAERTGIPESEIMDRVARLKEAGIIRKIGASFDTRKLGHASVLVAARVPEDRLEEVAATISSFPQVTHNYGRDFEYNLWFTVVSDGTAGIDRILQQMRDRTGISELHQLPAERLFKIEVNFEF